MLETPWQTRAQLNAQPLCGSMQLVDEWSGQSYRVLAIALAQVPSVASLNLASMSQQQVEDQAGPFELVGLTILSNLLNSDSKATVKQLQEQ
jgi:magnesium-transporting ATPase (P-type)